MKNLIFILFLLNSVHSLASNYYIRNGGSDLANGLSDESAWASVAKVVSSMQLFNPGDSILFKKGSVWMNALLTVGRAGLAGKNIVISSYGQGSKPVLSARPGMPVIQATTAGRGYWSVSDLDIRASSPPEGHKQSQGISFSYWLFDLGPVPGWEISNCRFNCSVLVSGPDTWIHHNIFEGDYNQNGYNNGGAIIVRGPEGDNCIIEYNTIYGWIDRGIWILRGGSNPVIRCNTAYDILGDYPRTDNPGSGINIDGYGVAISGAKIYNNYVYNCSGLGIFLENAFETEAYNNKLINNVWGGFSIYWYPEHQGEPSYVNIHHNLIHNGSWGILVNLASYWIISNNVFIKDDVSGAAPDRNALFVSSPSTFFTNGSFVNNIIAGTGYIHAIKLPDTKNIWKIFDYNIIQPVGTEIVNTPRASLNLSQLQSLGFMKHGSTSDPKFVDIMSDWHLQSGSPAINAGINMNYKYDFEYTKIDSLPDIGAFEYDIAEATEDPLQIFKYKDIIFYPNPSMGSLKINNNFQDNRTYRLKIFHFSGVLCLDSEFDSSSKIITIPLHLKSGIYSVSIFSGNEKMFSQTLIIL